MSPRASLSKKGAKPQNVVVMVSDPVEGFVQGEIVGDDGVFYKIKLTNAAGRVFTQEVRKEEVMRAAAEAAQGRGVRDNTQLTHLNEGSLLLNLKTRYAQDEIYTYTGFILLAVNPYRLLPIYGEDVMESYTGRRVGAADPHPFAIAERAYRLMKRECAGQAIIISGESGAGKTETCKHVLKYLAHVGRAKNTEDLGRRLLESNPMLEAFGNAKTLRNNNSSRFGKFMKVNFGQAGEVLGAEVSTYLLERSRLVQQDSGERNYHVFYQMLAGLPAAEKARLRLKQAKDYAFLTGGGCCAIAGVDDAADFGATRRAMGLVGLSEGEQADAVRCLAAILHIGNVAFEEDADGGAAAPHTEDLRAAAELLGVELERLEKALVTRTIVDAAKRSPNSRRDFTKPLTVAEATDARNSLAKAVYQRLFDWLVARVNAGLRTAGEVRASIGVLDIFGFEVFERNSFEQLCINYANEKLQQHFNSEVFEQEQELYRQEALRWGDVQYKSCNDCIEAIERAVLPVLEDAVNPNIKMAPDDVAEAVHARAAKLLPAGRDPRLVPARGLPRRRGFAVRHFAAEVAYETAAMVEKNRDSLHGDLAALLAASAWPFLSATLAAPAAQGPAPPPTPGPAPRSTAACPQTPSGKAGAAGRDKGAGRVGSVCSKFSAQLNALLTELKTMSAHFIRCIKPNGEQRSRSFDGALIRSQLAASGMNEAVRLLNEGYPTRCAYDVIYARFAPVCPPLLRRLHKTRFAEALLLGLEVPTSRFQLGLTMAFFRADALAGLEEMLLGDDYKMPPEMAERIRRWYIRRCWWRARIAATYSRKMVHWYHRSCFERKALRAALAAVRLARWAREVRVRLAARRVFNALRTWHDRKRYLTVRRGVRRLQARARGVLARLEWGPKVKAAVAEARRRMAEERDASRREEAQRLRQAAAEKRAEQQRAEQAKVEEMQRRAAAERARAEEERAREEEARRREEEGRRQAEEDRRQAEEDRFAAAVEARLAGVRAELEARLAGGPVAAEVEERLARVEAQLGRAPAEVEARLARIEERLEAARAEAGAALAELREGLRAAQEASEAAVAAAEMARTEAEEAGQQAAAGRESAERDAREALERLEGHSRELTAAAERSAAVEASLREVAEEAGSARDDVDALHESVEELQARAAEAAAERARGEESTARVEARVRAAGEEAAARFESLGRELASLREDVASAAASAGRRTSLAAAPLPAGASASARALAAATGPDGAVEDLKEAVHEAYAEAMRRVEVLEARNVELARKQAEEAAGRVKAEAALEDVQREMREWREWRAAMEMKLAGPARVRRSLEPLDANAPKAPPPPPAPAPEKEAPPATPERLRGVARTPNRRPGRAGDQENAAAPQTAADVVGARPRTVIDPANVLEEVEAAAMGLWKLSEDSGFGTRPALDPNCDEMLRMAEAMAVLLRHGLRPVRRGLRDEPRHAWDVLEAYAAESRRRAEEATGRPTEGDPLLVCMSVVPQALAATSAHAGPGTRSQERLQTLVGVLLDEGRLLEALQRLWACGPVLRELFEPHALLRSVHARARIARALRPLEGRPFPLDPTIARASANNARAAAGAAAAASPSHGHAGAPALSHGAPQASQRSVVVV